MKKQILFAFAFAISLCVHAQYTLSPTVIASTGGFATAGGTSLSYTVGELGAIQTFRSANGNYIFTQGFQQPNDTNTVNGLLDIEKGTDGSFSVYPVPAKATLTYGYQFSETGKVEISLYTITGQKLDYNLSEAYNTGKVVHTFDCSIYASGSYILTVKYTSTSGVEHTLSKKAQFITN